MPRAPRIHDHLGVTDTVRSSIFDKSLIAIRQAQQGQVTDPAGLEFLETDLQMQVSTTVREDARVG